MWDEGMIAIDQKVVYTYFVKHFDERSQFGIDGGKISKLEIRQNNIISVHYDRGWITHPITEVETAIYDMIIKIYN